MTDLKRPIIIMMIILGFLMPGGFIYSYERNPESEEEDDTGAMINEIMPETQVWSSSLRPGSNDRIFHSPQRETTRGQNGDLMMDWDGMLKYADISDAPFQTLYQDIQGNHDFMWGEKNTTITYHPIIKNDGNLQVNQFTFRLVVHEVYHEAGSWRIRRELVNKTKNIGPLPGNTNTTNQGLNTSISGTVPT